MASVEHLFFLCYHHPMDTKKRIYACIDLKSFYASAECVARGLDPLTADLVVADKTRTDKTICLAVSPSLKSYGISGRARLFEVNQRLEQVRRSTGKKVDFIIAPPRMAYYVKVSSEIYSIYLEYLSAEDIHVYSIDEVFMDLTDYLSFYNMSAHELVMKMVRTVLERTGITATAGIGTNMYLTKIAMDIVAKHVDADSDGVRIAELNERKFREFLWGYKPLTDFWGIGRRTADRLRRYGLETMGDIARRSIEDEEFFYKVFGIDGEIMIDHAWGIEPVTMKDIKNYRTSTSSLSSGQVLSTAYKVKNARLVVKEMADNMVFDLVRKELLTASMTLTIIYDAKSLESMDYKGNIVYDPYGRPMPEAAHGTVNFGSPTSSSTKIISGITDLFDRIVDSELLVRRIYISANNTVSEKGTGRQLDMFTDPEKEEKEYKIQKAALEIREKYGKNSLIKGMNLEEGGTAIERNSQIGGHRA